MKAIFSNGKELEVSSVEEQYLVENRDTRYSLNLSCEAEGELAELVTQIADGIDTVNICDGDGNEVKTFTGYTRIGYVTDRVSADGGISRTVALRK